MKYTIYTDGLCEPNDCIVEPDGVQWGYVTWVHL